MDRVSIHSLQIQLGLAAKQIIKRLEAEDINIVQQFGASILNENTLKEIPFKNSDLSAQAKDFFNDNKKISSQKI